MRKLYVEKPLQHRDELALFLKFIVENGISSYLEIGSKFGGSLWHVTNAMPAGSLVVSVELPVAGAATEQSLRECVRELKARGYDARLFLGDSTSEGIVAACRLLAPFDLVLIDANHTESYVRKDFANYGQLGRFCCFHDIGWRQANLPGRLPIEVPKVWAELKTTHAERASFREIMLDKGHNGIGILQWH